MNKVIWLTGLSGAGKTTIATKVINLGLDLVLLDGDVLREGLCKDLQFTISDRKENIRRVAEVAKLFINNNKSCICSFISPTNQIRDLAKSIIGAENFIEVYVNTPFNICENRDTKGLYKLAKDGKIKNFTGLDSIYEKPKNPDFILDCYNHSVEKSSIILYKYLKKVLY
jgi:adenylylsulfate kinase